MPISKNYILRLQEEKAELEARIAATEAELSDFRAHIDGPKFTGTDADGGRKDWIATADVAARIERIRLAVKFD